ncbi:MAG: hypothetical protein Q8L55_03935 [Phycisphaerales bacterium]|nr:hypothetical protein [Phycisphaerales bacterium]
MHHRPPSPDGAHQEDPLIHARRCAQRWVWVAAAALPLLVWALWPIGERDLPSGPAPAPVARAGASQRLPLQIAAFDAPIWTLDPPLPAPSTPPPPLRLQLVGMVRDSGAGTGGVLKAVIYDPDADGLVVVAEGARVGPRTVTRIDATGVTLTDATGTRRLLMEQGIP